MLSRLATLFAFDTNLTTANSFRDDVEAVQGQELLGASFPQASAPRAT